MHTIINENNNKVELKRKRTPTSVFIGGLVIGTWFGLLIGAIFIHLTILSK